MRSGAPPVRLHRAHAQHSAAPAPLHEHLGVVRLRLLRALPAVWRRHIPNHSVEAEGRSSAGDSRHALACAARRSLSSAWMGLPASLRLPEL